MKEIWWIPTHCRDLFDESLLLSGKVSRIRYQCGRHASFKQGRSLALTTRCEAGLCENCHQLKYFLGRYHLAAHHITPVWVSVLAYICATLAEDDSCIVRGNYPTFQNLPFLALYEAWNAPERLLMVCDPCHTKLEQETDTVHRKNFLARYPTRLFFNYDKMHKYWQRRMNSEGSKYVTL